MLCFYNRLPWLGIETYVSNIAISFYRNIVCKNVECDVGLNTDDNFVNTEDRYKNFAKRTSTFLDR